MLHSFTSLPTTNRPVHATILLHRDALMLGEGMQQARCAGQMFDLSDVLHVVLWCPGWALFDVLWLL